MIILGIDPGLARVGYGLIDKNNNQIKMLDCGIIKTDKGQSEGQRMVEIAEDLKEIILKWNPDIAVVEKLFFYTSSTKISVVQARGVVIMTLTRFQIPIVEFPPMQIKLALAGSGHANKDEVMLGVMKELNLENKMEKFWGKTLDKKKGLTITRELLGIGSDDGEIVEFSEKEKEEFLRDVTSISDDDGESWICAFCEMEKESNIEKHLFQHGLVCPDCFDSAMGFD